MYQSGWWSAVCGAILFSLAMSGSAAGGLRCGTAVVDISPQQFPVLVNGGMLSRQATEIVRPIHARALVLDNGSETIAIVVVDSCMLPRPLLDDAKQIASRRTGIPTDRMLISATHTHTAPASMGCLGTEADETYIPLIRERLAQSITEAKEQLQPVHVGWGVISAADFTATRRWIYRTDMVQNDPFGNPTVRANMHAANRRDAVTGPSGAEDPDLSLISFQTPEGKQVALLANFSMHYFSGVKPIHPDYFGLFSDEFTRQLDEKTGTKSGCVAMMSHGCSGDIFRKDYQLLPEERNDNIAIDDYTQGLLNLAFECHAGIEHHPVEDLAMQEKRFELKYRTPNVQLLEWSRRIVAEMEGRPPKNTTEVYALEQIILHERQSTEIVVQAIRIGEIAIATTPNETYALTGYKLKLQSPLPQTMVIELANGGDGYIPPPEQHWLGGYNTWAARSAGLEVEAEPKITAAGLALLEQVSGKSRRAYQQPLGSAAATVLDQKPVAYYRLDEFTGPRAVDHSPHGRDGLYEPGVAYFLEGPDTINFSGDDTNRAAHFAGGRLNSRLANIGEQYTISLWFWNGMPAEGRETCGWLLARGRDYDAPTAGEQLGLQGTNGTPGVLLFQAGDETPVEGKTPIERWTWNHVLLTRDGARVNVYLNGNREPEISTSVSLPAGAHTDQFFFAGRADRQFGFEGRLDEIALFDRVLSTDERRILSPTP